ncbi:DUF167 domain-containing protein [Candidatus Falkowbacteria bacterium]|nr:DUF167 domain-containing protein [Candidatus Falkowbacteria bacterium]
MFTELAKEFKEKGEVYLRLKVRPGAQATEAKGILAGEEGDTIKVDVAAAPEQGKANLELVRYLADWFSVAKDQVKIVSGAGDKVKLVKIIK